WRLNKNIRCCAKHPPECSANSGHTVNFYLSFIHRNCMSNRHEYGSRTNGLVLQVLGTDTGIEASVGAGDLLLHAPHPGGLVGGNCTYWRNRRRALLTPYHAATPSLVA